MVRSVMNASKGKFARCLNRYNRDRFKPITNTVTKAKIEASYPLQEKDKKYGRDILCWLLDCIKIP